jgi:hypothetical protein
LQLSLSLSLSFSLCVCLSLSLHSICFKTCCTNCQELLLKVVVTADHA